MANLSFNGTNNANADFRIVLDTNEMEADTDGRLSPPGEPECRRGRFQWHLRHSRTAGGSLEKGGYEFMVMIHEVLHGLGLAHPHDDGGTSTIMKGVSSDTDLGAFDLNQGVYTAMTYNNGYLTGGKSAKGDSDKPYGYEAGPMALDIAVLQKLYGANMETAKGDNSYTLFGENASGTHWQSIWDAGGKDEITFAGTRDATIDLREATLKYEVGGGGFVSSAKGIAGGFTIANGVTIENASGGSGDDNLHGNKVANKLQGNAGNDEIVAGRGNDSVKGGQGDDDLSGNKGNDRLWGHNGDDVVSGGSGNDLVKGNLGNDKLSGNSGDDKLIGGKGNDVLRGNVDNDVLRGDTGNDKLIGGNGDDTLAGNGGNDRMNGGRGSDSFIFDKGHDVVTDFADNTDTIVLHNTLWGGADKSTAEILEMASVVNGDTVFDFGDGNTLTLAGFANISALSNDITVL